MSEEAIDGLDDILKEVLAGDDTDEVAAAPDITFAQSVSTAEQTTITDDRIEWLASELEIPGSTVQMAKSLRDQYRQQRGDLMGTSLELVAAACLYCAVKVTEVPLDPTDFEDADDTIVTRKLLLRRSKDIAKTVGLDPSAFFGSKQYVDRYCDELDVSPAVAARAKEIIDLTERLASGKSPTGWAAAAVYNACLDLGEKRTQTEISNIAHVTEVTVRNRYQEQREGIREATDLPDSPERVLDHVATALRMSSSQRELAWILISESRDAGEPVDDEPTLWALAALRRAGSITGNKPQLKSLSQYTEAESNEISTREKTLRTVALLYSIEEYRDIHRGPEDSAEAE